MHLDVTEAACLCVQVLIFSTMTRTLDIIEDLLDWRGFDFARLDGSTSTAERGDIVRSFSAPDSCVHVFLLSVRAGGVGLNLQAADTVIMYDTGKRILIAETVNRGFREFCKQVKLRAFSCYN